MLQDIASLATIVVLLLIPLGGTFRRYKTLLDGPKPDDPNTAAGRLRKRLAEGSPAEKYRQSLKAALVRLGRLIGDVAPDGTSRGRFYPLTAQAFGVNLYLSFVYPILFLFLNWIFHESAGDLRGLRAFDPEATAWYRFGVVVSSAAFGYVVYMHSVSEYPKHLLYYVAGGVCAVVVALFAGSGITIIVFLTPILHVVNAITPGGFPYALMAIFAVTCAVGMAIFTTFQIPAFVALSVAVLVSVIAVFAAHAVRLQFSPAAVSDLWKPTSTLGYYKEWRSTGWFYLIVWAGCLALTVFGFRYGSGTDDVAIILNFLIFLPLINAPLDWLSLALTRYLLDHSLKSKRFMPLIWSALDLLGALLLLLVLAVALTAAVAGANRLAQAGGAPGPLIDLKGLFDNLATRPSDRSLWWIYAMLFSTLLPTFVHFVIAGLGLTTVRPLKRFTDQVVVWMDASFTDQEDRLSAAACILTMQLWLVIVLVAGFFAAAGWGLFALAPRLGDGIFAALRATAALVGP